MSKYSAIPTSYPVMKEYEHTADLDVLLCDEPGPVCQQLVERLQAAEFGGRVLEAA